MRFSVQLPTHRVEAGDEFVSATAIGEMARAAERAGFDACFVTDHPFPTDKWMAGGGHHSLDPFVALAFAAAATETIRLQTHVLVLPYRSPFIVANAAATLDRASGGRLILGTAAGYLKGEFHALGADFEHRNEISDDALRAIRRAWTENGLEMSGRGFSVRGNTSRPLPVQEPGPPIWVGGNSRLAIRRAVELGDGWLPFPNERKHAAYRRTAVLETLEDLRHKLDFAREHAERVGRTEPLDVCFSPFESRLKSEGLAGHVGELAALGVTWLALAPPPPDSRARWCESIARLGQQLALSS